MVCRIILFYGNQVTPPAAAQTWLSLSSDSPARQPIPHAARGLAAVLARAGSAGAVVDGCPQ